MLMGQIIKVNEADYASFFQSTWSCHQGPYPCQAECAIGHLVLNTTKFKGEETMSSVNRNYQRENGWHIKQVKFLMDQGFP